jgi:hypothetical protein
MRTVSYFGYEPGLTDGNDATSTGNTHWLKHLIKNIEASGMKFLNGSVGEKSVRSAERFEALHNGTVFLISWRWPMDAQRYRMRSIAYDVQLMVLDYAARRNIPVIIHDSDMMDDSIDSFVTSNCILTSPLLNPPAKYKQLLFPRAYSNQIYIPLDKRAYDVSYVGNNYLRYEQMRKTYAEIKGHDINVWGNWLESSPNRESPEQVMNDFPGVLFHGRTEQNKIQDILSMSRITHGFAKPNYCEYGFLSPRLFEATSSGCVILFPDEFFTDEWIAPVFKGINIDNIIGDEQYYKSVLQSQREVADELDGTDTFIKMLKSL